MGSIPSPKHGIYSGTPHSELLLQKETITYEASYCLVTPSAQDTEDLPMVSPEFRVHGNSIKR